MPNTLTKKCLCHGRLVFIAKKDWKLARRRGIGVALGCVTDRRRGFRGEHIAFVTPYIPLLSPIDLSHPKTT